MKRPEPSGRSGGYSVIFVSAGGLESEDEPDIAVRILRRDKIVLVDESLRPEDRRDVLDAVWKALAEGVKPGEVFTVKEATWG
jgi:hypothetical protein